MENQKLTTNKTQSLTSLTHYEVQLKTVKGYDNVKTCIELSIQSNETKIGQVIREGGLELIKLHVTEAIATYISLLPQSKSMSPEAIITMGTYLSEHPDMRHLSISELKTFFNLAFKQQRFGKLYGGFGYDTLLDWFNQYFDLRMQEVINYREREHTYNTQQEKQRRERTDGDAFGGFLRDIQNLNPNIKTDGSTND
jgi:hypothetical protein